MYIHTQTHILIYKKHHFFVPWTPFGSLVKPIPPSQNVSSVENEILRIAIKINFTNIQSYPQTL